MNQVNVGPRMTESGNYGFSIGEAAHRWNRDTQAMFDHVNKEYPLQRIMPVCVLCEKSCKMKLESERWFCDRFTLSAKTICQFPERSQNPLFYFLKVVGVI